MIRVTQAHVGSRLDILPKVMSSHRPMLFCPALGGVLAEMLGSRVVLGSLGLLGLDFGGSSGS